MAYVPNQKQIPDHSILDQFNKQIYLGQQFLYAANAQTITGTAESDIILIQNPADSGKALFLNFKKIACLTASQSALLRAYLNPTFSDDGTPVTPLNLRPNNPNLSVALVSVLPTASVRGTFLDIISAAAFQVSVSNTLIVLDPGQNVLISGQVSATSSVAAALSWYEL